MERKLAEERRKMEKILETLIRTEKMVDKAREAKGEGLGAGRGAHLFLLITELLMQSIL